MTSYITDTMRLCLTARARSSDAERLPQAMDLEGVLQIVKTFAAVVLFPTLAAPLAALHGYGLFRCGRTMSLPYSVPQPMFEPGDVQVVVHRRKYDTQRKRIVEDGCYFDNETIEYGLKVAGSRRDEFVDDPSEPGTSYFVMERRKLNKKFMIQGQSWAWAFLDDFLMFGFPLFVCMGFFKPARHFHADVAQWMRGILPMTQIRHPIGNFFLGINDYNRAKLRRPKHSGMKPWNYKV